MKIAMVAVLILTLVSPMILAGCGEDAEATCSCDEGKAGGTTWCEKCEKGYVKGDATKCEGCYVAKATGGPACEKCAAK